ncbi:Rid family hydrolase [Aeromicrobium sp. REDSEA-S32_B7]|jgi:enamine deaminase RidA (YjgF/YER057c/UK114 family)|uniref:Rid family hydrolase n=1 Tax=unclassified Aeromicrobium TaxID=2633570 RepID=UPI000A5DE6C2|nr:Rid family hydrolase [Aeromicrobium sp. REDSEA-S32_B7]
MIEVNPSLPVYHLTPGDNPVSRFQEQLGYSQAVRIGDRVEISGQGGWNLDLTFPDDLEAEIVQAFDNVAMVLAEAGASWSDVVSVDSFHLPDADDQVGERPTRVMVEQMRARMDGRRPIWTQVGVAALGAPGMRVEIRVTATAPAAA